LKAIYERKTQESKASCSCLKTSWITIWINTSSFLELPNKIVVREVYWIKLRFWWEWWKYVPISHILDSQSLQAQHPTKLLPIPHGLLHPYVGASALKMNGINSILIRLCFGLIKYYSMFWAFVFLISTMSSSRHQAKFVIKIGIKIRHSWMAW